MTTKDLVFAFRNLRRNKILAAINVLGLSIGISACLIIFLVVNYEMSFDRFQPDTDRIFRLYASFSGRSSGLVSGVPTAFPVAIRETFTGIEAVTNFHTFSAGIVVPGPDNTTKQLGHYPKVIITDPEYFEVFNHYTWVVGSPAESLSEPHRVVLTDSRAKLYFGDVDPFSMIGREVLYRDSLVVTVSGIVMDVEGRTDLDFTDFISFKTIESSWLGKNDIRLNSWQNFSSTSQVFLKLSPGTAANKLDAQLLQLTATYEANNKDAAGTMTPKLQRLEDLHFNSELRIFNHSRSVVAKSTLQMLIAVAGLLLIIAVINFVNLQTAQASRRAKEVGVRKVLGSSRGKLILRFLTESFILCFLAAIVSVVLAQLAFRYFPEFTPEGFNFVLSDPLVVSFLISCLVVVTLFAGLYPAFVLSSYQPALALKNLASSTTATTRSAVIRKGLTIFQFSVAQVLIIGTIVILGQLRFMLDKDLGFDVDAVVFINVPHHENADRVQSFRNELQQHPEVEALTLHGHPPLTAGYASGILGFDNGKEIVKHNVHLKHGDTSYLSVYGIELLAGRNVLPVDSAHELLINETYMKLLGFIEPRDVIGKVIDNAAPIVGVVRDFHGQPLRSEIKPTAISYRPGRNVGVKLTTPNSNVSDLKEAISNIKSSYKKIFPDQEFQYFFVDERIEQYYQTEQRMGKVAGLATVVAIVISCLGLLGLSSFTVIQRTKEIGIRKVLGASVSSILFLLSKDFLKLVFIAFLLSAPIAYYVTGLWLEKFAYKMDVTVWIFMASGVASVFIALMTISFRTVNAAKADPVKALRYE